MGHLDVPEYGVPVDIEGIAAVLDMFMLLKKIKISLGM